MDLCIAEDLTFSVWGQTIKLDSLRDLQPWEPPCNRMQNSLSSLVLPRIEKHVGKESQFPTQQIHHPRRSVKVPIPL